MQYKIVLKKYDYFPIYKSDPVEWEMNTNTISTTFLDTVYDSFFEAVSSGDDIIKKLTGKGFCYFDGEKEIVSEYKFNYLDTDKTDPSTLEKMWNNGEIRKYGYEYHLEIQEVC